MAIFCNVCLIHVDVIGAIRLAGRRAVTLPWRGTCQISAPAGISGVEMGGEEGGEETEAGTGGGAGLRP